MSTAPEKLKCFSLVADQICNSKRQVDRVRIDLYRVAWKSPLDRLLHDVKAGSLVLPAEPRPMMTRDFGASSAARGSWPSDDQAADQR
jgi:hypothetical protein